MRYAVKSLLLTVLAQAGIHGQEPGAVNLRPARATITVGPAEGDIRGSDDKALQAAADSLARFGGGVLKILPGEYTMNNALHLYSNLTVVGSGAATVLRKAPSVRTRITRDSDWYENTVEVENPAGFRAGGAVMLQSKGSPEGGSHSLQMNILRVDGNVLTLHDRLNKNFRQKHDASAATLFPLIRGMRANDVRVENIFLDGNRQQNEEINGNYAGAIFMQWCDRVVIQGVICRNYNGDGISLQVCDDAHVLETVSENNANLGFHPGSGSQRPVFRNCTARGNSLGFFFCWGVRDGLVERCSFTDNRDYGISFGHRDTDNVVRDCRIERNGKVGVLFRKEENEFYGGHRNVLERCEITDNGAAEAGCGVDIRGETHDIAIVDCSLGDTGSGIQKIGVRIGPKAQRIRLERNRFTRMLKQVERLPAEEPAKM